MRICSIFFICSLGFIPAWGQKNSFDKTAYARFEKNIEQGKVEEIERALLDFAVANPNNPKVLELLAKARFQQNRLTEAASLYRRVLSLDANAVSGKIALARILNASNQKDEARRMLGEIDQTSILETSARLNLASAFLLVGESEKALKSLDKLPVKIKNSDALPVFAAIYLEKGEKEKLADLIPSMKKAAVSNANLAVQCAEILQNAGFNKEAVDLLKPSSAANPNDFRILVQLAKAEIGAKQFPQAKQHLNRAAKIQTGSAEVIFLNALLEEAQGNSAAAFELLNQARRISPESPAILSHFVISAMRANRASQAVEAAQILLGQKPDEPEYLYLLGAAALQKGDLKTAQQNLERLTEMRPRDSRGCLAYGLTLAAQPDKIENARKALERCIEIDANNFEARYQLGLSYKTQGDTAKAVQYLEDTVRQSSDYALALRDLGAVYLQAGEEAKARIVLEKSAALAPNDADTHFQLSRLYNLIGEKQLAKKHLEMFQKLRSSTGNPM